MPIACHGATFVPEHKAGEQATTSTHNFYLEFTVALQILRLSDNSSQNFNSHTWHLSNMGSLTQEWAPTPKLSDSVMKMFDMAGKVAIVTGGSGGIGYEAARALAEAGSNVSLSRFSAAFLTFPKANQIDSQIALWYSQANNTDKLAATIERDLGVKAMAYKCAVENFEEVRDQAAAVVRDFGRLDVIIANAGISRPASKIPYISKVAPAWPLTFSQGGIDDPVENWEQVIGVNLDGAYYCAKVAGEIFRKQGSGNFIFNASISGHIANVPQRQVGFIPFSFDS